MRPAPTSSQSIPWSVELDERKALSNGGVEGGVGSYTNQTNEIAKVPLLPKWQDDAYGLIAMCSHKTSSFATRPYQCTSPSQRRRQQQREQRLRWQLERAVGQEIYVEMIKMQI